MVPKMVLVMKGVTHSFHSSRIHHSAFHIAKMNPVSMLIMAQNDEASCSKLRVTPMNQKPG